ncbi:hypothetical protein Tco_0760752 [Tanacetum coccineum]
MQANELYKILDGMLKSVHDILHHKLLNFILGYNKDMPRRKWSATDQRYSGLMVDLIDKKLLERRIIWNLERLVGARKLEMDYRLMQGGSGDRGGADGDKDGGELCHRGDRGGDKDDGLTQRGSPHIPRR